MAHSHSNSQTWPRRARRSGLSLALLAKLGRSRQALATLDPHLLRDIGLTAQEAESESSRPFWDVPETWKSR